MEERTIEGYDLDDVDLVAGRDELLPAPDEEPVIATVDPLRVRASARDERSTSEYMRLLAMARGRLTFLFHESCP